VSFEEALTSRSAAIYADFLVPHLARDATVLDVGCGSGSITIGLASEVGTITGIDVADDEFRDARGYAETHGIDNVEFCVGSVYELEFPDEYFDACLAHSMVETLERPVDGLREIGRTLRPGGIVGLASVEYGGLIIAGPDEPILRRFYEIREHLWQVDGVADPFRGRTLRGLLGRAGFERVEATTHSISYGTAARVRAFGLDRADDCRDEWYASEAIANGLASSDDLGSMEQAWLTWSESPDAYASFSWGRAIGFTPDR
jgi:SAM-dependent methyltransferase